MNFRAASYSFMRDIKCRAVVGIARVSRNLWILGHHLIKVANIANFTDSQKKIYPHITQTIYRYGYFAQRI